jgi:hypothetical protein
VGRSRVIRLQWTQPLTPAGILPNSGAPFAAPHPRARLRARHAIGTIRAASGAGRRPAGASGHVRWVAAQRPARAPASLVFGDLPRSMWPIRVSERKPMRWRGPGGFPPPLTGRTGWPGVKGTEPVGTPGGAPPKETAEKTMAGTTGLEPATSDVTGRRSNQLNYVPAQFGHFQYSTPFAAKRASWTGSAAPSGGSQRRRRHHAAHQAAVSGFEFDPSAAGGRCSGRNRHWCSKIKEARTVGAWRSLVAHLPWAQGVAGSNPAAPTNRIINLRHIPIQAADKLCDLSVPLDRLLALTVRETGGPPPSRVFPHVRLHMAVDTRRQPGVAGHLAIQTSSTNGLQMGHVARNHFRRVRSLRCIRPRV